MNTDLSSLGRTNVSFALAAAFTVLFNTALALLKDCYSPLNKLMSSVTGHHWITHALADLVVFVGLGLIIARTNLSANLNPHRVIDILTGAVVVAGLGLFGWYLLF